MRTLVQRVVITMCVDHPARRLWAGWAESCWAIRFALNQVKDRLDL